jgi:hypothetical protein
MNDHVPDSAEHVPAEPWARILTMRAWPWFATLQRCAVASIALGWLAGRAATSAHGAYSPSWVVFGLLIALRWIAGARVAFRNLQRPEHPRHPRLSQLFYVVVPTELVGVMRLLAMTLAAGVLWLLRRPVPRRPPGLLLEDRRKGFYNALFAMNVVGAITEIPLSFLILPGLVPEEGVRIAVHCLEVLLNLAILGDRWLVDAGGHILTGSRRLLCAGLRASADVPISEILEIDVVPKSMSLAAWSRSRGLDPWDAGVISVLDGPNVALQLVSGPLKTWTRLQAERPRPSCLFLYVDDPAALVRMIATARERDPPS